MVLAVFGQLKKGNKNTSKMHFSASSQWSKICFGYQGIIFNGEKFPKVPKEKPTKKNQTSFSFSSAVSEFSGLYLRSTTQFLHRQNWSWGSCPSFVECNTPPAQCRRGHGRRGEQVGGAKEEKVDDGKEGELGLLALLQLSLQGLPVINRNRSAAFLKGFHHYYPNP